MLFERYILLISNFMPVKIDKVNLNLISYFMNGEEEWFTISQIHKTFNPSPEKLSYKDLHERILYLSRNRLLMRSNNKLRYGAIPYRISPYGIITYYANLLSEDKGYLVRTKERTINEDTVNSQTRLSRQIVVDFSFNDIIRLLLLEFFEEQTIASIYKIRGFPVQDIAEYIHECCRLTIVTMTDIYAEWDKHPYKDLLPRIEIIREYTEFLFEFKKPFDKSNTKNIEMYRKEVEQNLKKYQDKENFETLSKFYLGNEIPSFKLKQLEKLGENRKEFLAESGIIEDPIFEGISLCIPLNDIFTSLNLLREKLEYKINALITMIISRIGLYVSLEAEDNSVESFEKVFEYEDSMFLINMFKDKKLYEFVKSIKVNFDKGYEQFNWYQNYKMEI